MGYIHLGGYSLLRKQFAAYDFLELWDPFTIVNNQEATVPESLARRNSTSSFTIVTFQNEEYYHISTSLNIDFSMILSTKESNFMFRKHYSYTSTSAIIYIHSINIYI